MKVLCDQMLGSLATWLRFLGIDTFYVKEQLSDDDLLQIARKEKRILITKDKELTLRGDCIVGVKSDFSLLRVKKFIKKLKQDKIKILFECGDFMEEINAQVSPRFNSSHEMVIRKSEFKDRRTFAVRADKASIDLKRDFIENIKNQGKKIIVTIVEE